MKNGNKKPAQIVLRKFRTGNIYMTQGVRERMDANPMMPLIVAGFLTCHVAGKWGEVGKEDSATNDRALLCGGRLLSQYVIGDDEKIWIITEADRSSTTILFPHEY